MNSSLIEQLECLFNPKSIAVVGASNDFTKWGNDVFTQVMSTTADRKVYPVNNRSPEILGINAFKNVKEVPDSLDFVAIVVPYTQVTSIMRDCVEKGVKTALIISAGLKEAGEEGAKIQDEISRIAKEGSVRFVGPNCMGHFNTAADLCTMRRGISYKKGPIGLISQSGGFAWQILEAGFESGIGFSKCVSSGNEADLHFEDYLEYLAQDEATKVIVGYIEGLREGERFLKLAKEITKRKPVVVMKVGRTPTGAEAAKSHTAAISGEDAIYGTALNQVGVIRVDEIHEIFDVAAALLRQPLPRGRKVGILTAGGGHGVVTTDACEMAGLEIPPLSQNIIDKLDQILPQRWPHANPIDTVAADRVAYPCFWPLLEDETIDAILVVGIIGQASMWGAARLASIPLSAREQARRHYKTAEKEELENLDRVFELMERYQKPIIVCNMFASVLKDSPVFDKLRENGIMVYPTPERAVKVLAHLADYSEYLDKQLSVVSYRNTKEFRL